jgi:hypothetical protein
MKLTRKIVAEIATFHISIFGAFPEGTFLVRFFGLSQLFINPFTSKTVFLGTLVNWALPTVYSACSYFDA